jgi:hypothetical protein
MQVASIATCHWVGELGFSRFERDRRLAKDFENLVETLATSVIHSVCPQSPGEGVGLKAWKEEIRNRIVGSLGPPRSSNR